MDDDEDFPAEDTITPLARNANELHEIYLAYMQAGFTEDRAFDLANTILLHHLDS